MAETEQFVWRVVHETFPDDPERTGWYLVLPNDEGTYDDVEGPYDTRAIAQHLLGGLNQEHVAA